MKRWISSVACVALFSGAAFGQACGNAETCSAPPTDAKLVKAQTCSAPPTDAKLVKAQTCSAPPTDAKLVKAQTCSAPPTDAKLVKAETCSSCSTKSAQVISAALSTDTACSACSAGQASTVALASDKAINKVCPMTGMPITEAGLVKYEGKTLGFCGEGCAAHFNAATADEQAKIYNTILAAQPVANASSLALDEVPLSQLKSDPYTLDTCAVSGGKLGVMGEPITKVINGREVKFCCAGCVPKYEADPAKYNAKIDAMLIKQQLPYYPAQTCAVAGTPLMVDGEDIGKNVIVNNRLVRVCCAKCEAKLRADPATFFAKLDESVIAQQTKDYPLETCIVRENSQLGAMGKPVQLVSGNRLVKFCCAGCVEKFKANPAAYIAKLDKAWQTKHPEMFEVANAEPETIKATLIEAAPIISGGG